VWAGKVREGKSLRTSFIIGHWYAVLENQEPSHVTKTSSSCRSRFRRINARLNYLFFGMILGELELTLQKSSLADANKSVGKLNVRKKDGDAPAIRICAREKCCRGSYAIVRDVNESLSYRETCRSFIGKRTDGVKRENSPALVITPKLTSFMKGKKKMTVMVMA